MRYSTFGLCVAALVTLAGPALGQTAAPAGSQVQHSPAPAAEPQAQGPLTPAEIRELLASMRETAKATRESVDYGRVVPDILTQILNKLDKLEDKLDKVENAVKAQAKRR